MGFLESFYLNLALIWSHLEWSDLFDIFLVWLIVYRILIFIRRSGAAQTLLGLSFVFFAYLMSLWLDLSLMHWLLEQFFDNLVVFVVILFQGEIRRALAHIGKNPFFSGADINRENEALEELCVAVFDLADQGHGALLVLEKEIGLEPHLDSGVRLDAKIKSSLLMSIFHPTSPLHDGAVYIRSGRIESAGNLLPLSRNENIKLTYGTRHRAALGISEESDAICIVVSEERKTIAIVENGELFEVREFANLRNELLHRLNMERKNENA